MTAAPRLEVTAVGFDLGETLYHYGTAPLSWIELARPAIDRLLATAGVDRAKAGVAAFHHSVPSYSAYLRGRLEKTSPASVLTDVLAGLGGDACRRVETAVDAGFAALRRDLRPYPDAIETVAALKGAGFAVGALTNVPFGLPRRTIHRDLARTGLAPYVDGFVTSMDVGLRKPHRAAFEWLAATVGVAPREIAYVGNLPTDVSGAAACGCTPIFLDRTGSGGDYGQAATVRHLREVPPLLTLRARGGRS